MIYIIDCDTVKYDTMKLMQNDINIYEVRCNDMMSVHLHIEYKTTNWYHLVEINIRLI